MSLSTNLADRLASLRQIALRTRSRGMPVSGQSRPVATPWAGPLLFAVLGMGLYVVAMRVRLGPELLDDGAFFLRYAENMLRGEFWVWNRGEAPVWGASAPLYPLVLALPMLVGIEPVTASMGAGLALSAVALTVVAAALAQHVGVMAGVAFLAFSALDTQVMYFAGSGLESPLTYLLLGLGVRLLLGETRSWALAVVAGLLAVHKIDLAPAGLLLLLGARAKDRRWPLRATILAMIIAAAWYGFARIHFGSLVPNSFVTKILHQDTLPKSIDWRWFGSFVLGAGLHPALVALSALAASEQHRRLLPLGIFLGGILAVHLVAYTVRYPFEPYGWYGMPSVLALLVFGAIGIQSVANLLRRGVLRRKPWGPPGIALLVAGGVAVSALPAERRATELVKQFSAYQEVDRAEAGRWVSANTPAEFRMFTMWGNSAYFGRRYVYDGSFLNRPYEPGDLVARYRPEIVVLQNNPGVQPAHPEFPAMAGKGYEVARIFDTSHVAGMDYFFAVLIREDVLDRVSGRERPIDLLRFVGNATLGDRFGLLKQQGRQLFVHPGASTPTEFDLDVGAFLQETGHRGAQLLASIAPNVPAHAIRRGGANVRVRVMRGDGVVADATVRAGRPLRVILDGQAGGRYRIAVDSDGNADTDWLLISLR